MRRYGGLIVAAVRGIALMSGDIEDLTQEVFVRLCKDNFRLLRTYDPERAAMSLVNANIAAPINAAVAANVLSDNSAAIANAAQTVGTIKQGN